MDLTSSRTEPVPRPPSRPSLVAQLGERLRWFGVARAVAVGVSVAGVGIGGYWLLRTPPAPVESALPFASTTTTTARSGATAPTSSPASSSTVATTAAHDVVVVHVAGAVTTPGVYRLPVGARVVDAIATADGLRPDADVDVLNQAAVLRDGERIYVPAMGEAVPPVAVGSASPRPVGTEAAVPLDLNAATADELDALPGVGPATAAAIVAYRDEHGPFAAIDDLAEVRGIGPAKLEALRDAVRV